MRFLVPLRPISVNKMYRNFRGRMIKSREGREFEVAFNHYLGEFSNHAIDFLNNFNPHEMALHVDLICYIKSEEFFTASGTINKRTLDVDNALKCVLDQVFKFIDLDDGLVTKVSSSKVPSSQDSVEIILRAVVKPYKILDPEPRALSSSESLQ
jgi:Holliday junction resolvase RusA-like endonuclease